MNFTRRQTLVGLGGLLLGGALPPFSDAAEKHKRAAAVAEPAAPKALTFDDIWNDLMQGNRRFVEGKPSDRTLVPTRVELAKGQKPKVMVLGCSDSRALGSLEYAAEHLGTKLLVVLGHEKCGAVAAAAAGGKVESPNLSAIIRRINPALKPLREKVHGDELARQGVEANVHNVAKTIQARSAMLAHLLESNELAIVKAVYRLESGEVVKLT